MVGFPNLLASGFREDPSSARFVVNVVCGWVCSFCYLIALFSCNADRGCYSEEGHVSVDSEIAIQITRMALEI